MSTIQVAEMVKDAKLKYDLIKNRRNIFAALAIIGMVGGAWHLIQKNQDKRVVRENAAAVAFSVGVGLWVRKEHRRLKEAKQDLDFAVFVKEKFANPGAPHPKEAQYSGSAVASQGVITGAKQQEQNARA